MQGNMSHCSRENGYDETSVFKYPLGILTLHKNNKTKPQ